MSTDNRFSISGPAGKAISLSVSQSGDLYAGWSTGAVMVLRRDSMTFEEYIQGSGSSSPVVVRREAPLSKRFLLQPIAIDAWGSKSSQFIDDAYLNQIYEAEADHLKKIAGTGKKGSTDGDGLSSASFESIRSISVLPKVIAVLSATKSLIRIINRATNQVTTVSRELKLPPYHLLNASQSKDSDTVYAIAKDEWRLHASPIPTIHDVALEKAEYKFPLYIDPNASRCLFVCSKGSAFPAIQCQLRNGAYAELKLGFIVDYPFPAYCPLTDTLCMFSDGRLHIYKSFTGQAKDTSTLTFDFPTTSSLLEPTSFAPDLEIHHKASNTSLQLHRSVINQTMQQLREKSPSDQLSTFITSSTLPIATIQAFIGYRYFKPLNVASSLLLTFAWMSKTAFGTDDVLLLNALQRRVADESDASVCELLILAWINKPGVFELKATSLIVAVLLDRIRSCLETFKSTFDLMVITTKPEDLPILFPRMSALLILVSGSSQATTLPKIELPLVHHFLPAPSPNAEFLERYSTNVIFEISTIGSIGACGWLLYAHWPWFKSLIDSGFQESKTRVVSLPTSFTIGALHTILSTLSTGHMDQLERMSRNDHVSLLRHAEAFGLIDQDGHALLRIKPLVEASEAIIFPAPSASNCWTQLQLAIAIASSLQTSRLLDFVSQTIPNIPSRELALLPDQVALKLIQMVRDKEKLSPHE